MKSLYGSSEVKFKSFGPIKTFTINYDPIRVSESAELLMGDGVLAKIKNTSQPVEGSEK